MRKKALVIPFLIAFCLLFSSLVFSEGITIGSTKKEVIEELGAPDSMSNCTWWYGTSRISFSNGKVSGYSYGNSNLKIFFQIPNDPVAPDFITLNSSKEDIIRVLGAPINYSTYTWWYGTSRINFSNNKILGYSQGNTDLKIKILPDISPNIEKPISIDLGSTKDEVLIVLGEPQSLSNYTWWYGTSRISFSNSRVSGYSQGNVDLNIKIDPNGKYLNPTDDYGIAEQNYNYNGKKYSIKAEEERFSIQVSPTDELLEQLSENTSIELLKSYSVSDYYNIYHPFVAENGSYYGEISDYTGKPKNVYVKGYFRKDGTYVRSHYRSKLRW